MLRWLTGWALLTAVPVFPAPCQAVAPDTLWVQGGPYRLKTSIFRSPDAGPAPTLVVVLHGDAPFGKPDYQDRFAVMVATSHPDVVVAAILRPGYTDPRGNTSDGERGQTTGDNYNIQNTDAIAGAIQSLKARFRARRVVIAGHSGGAAITANILGRHPSLADAALLVSCPCDVPRWREHMLLTTKFEGFKGTIVTLSPVDQLPGISEKTVIRMVVGDHDEVAPPYLSEEYQTAALKAGKQVTLVQLKGEGHEIFLKPAVLGELGRLLRQ